MKKYLSFFVLIIFLNCSKEQVKTIDIEGDWHTGYKYNGDDEALNKNPSNYVYEEFFLKENRVFQFQNILGYRSPYFYKIKNDTLFCSYNLKGDYESSGKIVILNKNKFYLEVNNQKLYFFRLLNVKNTLSNFIRNKNKDDFVFEQKGTIYTQGFINRSKKYHSTLK